MHFASSTLVGESVTDPGKYYSNNVSKTIALLNCMRAFDVNTIVFSSSAAVYGAPQAAKINENSACMPINPYGRSKRFVEEILDDFRDAYGFRSYSLRYFNAAGADSGGELGERHDPETHLIPLVLQAASGRRSHISIFGRDHETPDGTCIRDYVHVEDLCDLHWRALSALRAGGKGGVFNAGNAGGYSVSQVIEAANEVTGRAIAVADAPRRAGDPPILVADASRAEADLGWKPNYPDLHPMIEHAWRWELQKGSRW
jgi:UDP-glucose 4-epimerase